MSDRASASDRLARLRAEMADRGLHGYVVPTADPHQSEYVPACWRRREWLSGFTGSAADVLVLPDRALLWTDSRYWLQAEAELDSDCWELLKKGAPDVPNPDAWLRENTEAGQAIGVDPNVLSVSEAKAFRKALSATGASLELLESNLVDAAWADRPARSSEPIRPLSTEWSGEAPGAKIDRVRAAMKEKDADALVVTALDAVAWLFDVRGTDVEFNPVAIAQAVVTPDDVQLFADEGKVTDDVRSHLPDGVAVRAYDDFGAGLDDVARRSKKVWIEPATCSAWVAERLTATNGLVLHEERSPITNFKARKNETEIAGARACHLRDGVAVVRFLAWLEGEVERGAEVTEISAAERLASFRAEGDHFQGLSFESISGFGDHGAIVHYRPDEEGHRRIDGSSLYLIDSGGQYLDGTTDITRTTCFGEPTAEQRDRFTRVLRGHVALARAVFPRGTTGHQLDVLARGPLWDAGLDYGHGTGHGVGAYLNVHEGPQGISPKAHDVALEPGMLLSNEPGYYRDGEYGIRIENLVVVVDRPELTNGGAVFRGFDTITACPIDRRMIVVEDLLPAERRWVDDYHSWVREGLSSRLDEPTRAWLERATAPL